MFFSLNEKDSQIALLIRNLSYWERFARSLSYTQSLILREMRNVLLFLWERCVICLSFNEKNAQYAFLIRNLSYWDLQDPSRIRNLVYEIWDPSRIRNLSYWERCAICFSFNEKNIKKICHIERDAQYVSLLMRKK